MLLIRRRHGCKAAAAGGVRVVVAAVGLGKVRERRGTGWAKGKRG